MAERGLIAIFKSWQGWLAMLTMAAALTYLGAKFDLLPDSLGLLGYVDDVSVIAIGAFAFFRLYARWGGENVNMAEFKGWKLPLALAATVAVFGYVLAPLDFIPDTTPIIGHLDDVALIVATIIAFLRVFNYFGKKGVK